MTASRLPIPGQDDGTWGNILNDYLTQSLSSAGTLNPAVVGTAQLQDGAVTATKLSPVSPTSGQILSFNGTALGWSTPSSSGTIPDADTTTKGIIKIAGDLGGSASAPTVPGLAGKEPAITAGTTGQYYRGDKSFQTLDKTAVGLTNVDNTSDINKPVSTATQNALNAKTNSSSLAVVATSGSYTDLLSKPAIPVVSDATANAKGIVQLSGDLGGTATSPTVPGLSSKEPTITAGTSTQYYRGDKSFQTLDKTAVGLSNVDNTSDVAKPISTATQTALNSKATSSSLATVATSGSYTDLTNQPNIPSVSDATASAKGVIQLAGDLGGTAAAPTVPGLSTKAVDTSVVHLAGNETVTGTKNFTGGATINGTNIIVATDTRLSDQRTPLDGSVTNAKLDSATQTAIGKVGTAVQQGALMLSVKDYGAFGDGTTDDTTAIQAVLAACPGGGIVYLPQGNYRISAPLIIPPNVTLRGSHANHLDDTGYVQSNTYIMPLAGFSGVAVLRLVDKQIGGYSADSCGQRIFNIMVEGSAMPNTGTGAIDAIRAEGKVHGVIIRDFCARNMPGHGINAIPFTRSDSTVVNPYSWRVQRAMADNCRYGFVFNTHTDSTFTDLEAIGNSRSGFYLFTMGNSQFINCRAEWSAWHGYEIHASGSYNHVMFTSCSTDRNGFDGIHVSDTGGNQVIIFNGMNLHRDGRNNGAGGGGYSGFNATSVTSPLILNGVVVSTGVDDDGTQANSPQYGITLATCTYASVVGSFFHGATAGWHDGGGNTTIRRGANVGEQTGAWNAPTMVLKNDWGTDNGSTFTANLNVVDANALAITNTATNAGSPLINFTTTASTDRLVSGKAAGDTATRYNLTTGGLQEWGSGAASRDTNLYRAAAGVIKTDNSLQVTAGLGINQSPPTSGIGESLTVADMVGLSIQNSAANASNPLIKLQTGASGTDYILKALVAADTATRYAINANGQQTWGSGAATADTNLYRAAAGVLQSDNVLSGKGMAVTGFTGATSSSRYVGATTSGAPITGTFLVGDFVIDQTAKIWICTTQGTPGTWTQVAASVTGAAGGDLGGTYPNPTVTATHLAASLPIAQGGTNAATATAAFNNLSPMTTKGDIEYESAANTASRLAGNTTAVPQFLASTGTGTVANNPVWQRLAGWQPSDHGLVTWSTDPAVTNATAIVPAAGQLVCVKVFIPATATVTNIIMSVSVAGSGLTSGQNYAALYSPAGTLLSSTADQSTTWAATGLVTMALATQQTGLVAGTYTIAFYANGTTLPSFRTGTTGASWVNAGLATANSRYGIANTGLTTAAPGTLSAITAITYSWWVALS